MRTKGLSKRELVVLAAATAGLAGVGFDGPAKFAGEGGGWATIDHTAFDTLLARRTVLGADAVVRVDYAGWKSSGPDRAALAAYIAAISHADPANLTRPEQFAFWANLYNALTISIVLSAWPVKSIRAIRPSLFSLGPWSGKVVRIAGVELSLDDIESGILRPGWKDSRVHYAINCASFSCPNLPRRAWRGATLDTRLDAAASAYVNHPRGARFDGDALTVSSIYRWYRRDFGGTDTAVIAHLAKYARPALRAHLIRTKAIAHDAYDWSVNAARAA